MFKNRPNRKFQAGLDQKEARREREKSSLSLRRKDRELKLQNKRKKILSENTKNPNNVTSSTSLQNPEAHQKSLQNLGRYVQGCLSSHPAAIYECTKKIRELISFSSATVPIKQVIDSGVIPRIIQLLTWNKHPNIQFEAMWVLTNISSSDKPEYTAVVVRNGAVPLICDILKIQKYPLQEQAIWALGNIAGECTELRDMIIENNVLSLLIEICKKPFDNNCYWNNNINNNNNNNNNNNGQMQYLTVLNTLSWTLSNLCRGDRHSKEEYALIIIECTYYLIKCKNQFTREERSEIEMNLMWMLQYLTQKEDFEYENKLLNKMNKCGITQELINLLNGPINACKPAVKAIGNILVGNDIYIKECVKYGLLKSFRNLFQTLTQRGDFINKCDMMTLKELCWCMSNIGACNDIEVIKCVMSENIFPILCQLLINTPSVISREALWALANATSTVYDNSQVIFYLCDQKNGCNFIKYLCDWNKKTFENTNYSSNLEKLLTLSLECIESILMSENKQRNTKYAELFEEYGGVDFFEYLQTIDNISEENYNKTVNIITKYFDGNEVVTNDNQLNENQIDIGFNANQDNNTQFDNQFGFGLNSSNTNTNNVTFQF